MMMQACMALGTELFVGTCASLSSQQSVKLSKPCLDRCPMMGRNWEAHLYSQVQGEVYHMSK
jgi:hypothetical protein